MKKSRFSEEKIIAALKQAEAGVKVSEIARVSGPLTELVSTPRFSSREHQRTKGEMRERRLPV